MRYNIFYDQMEFKDKDSVYAIGPDMSIKKVVIGSETFVVDNLEFKGKTVPLSLDSGRVSLVAKMLVIYKELRQGKPMQGDIPPRFERMPDTYYIKIGHGPLAKVSTVKKLIEMLPDRKQEMEKFTQNEKTRANKPDELTKFIRYYNSLQ